MVNSPENPQIFQSGGAKSGVEFTDFQLDGAARLIARSLLDFGNANLIEQWRSVSLEIKNQVCEMVLRFILKAGHSEPLKVFDESEV